MHEKLQSLDAFALKLHRQKSWLHPGPQCSPYVTPSVNTTDRLSPSLQDLDMVSSRNDVWIFTHSIVSLSALNKQLHSSSPWHSQITSQVASPSLFCCCDSLDYGATGTPAASKRVTSFPSKCSTSQRTFPLSPDRADPFRTNPDVIGRSRDGFSPLIGRHKTLQSCDWSEMSQTGEQLRWCSI